MTGPRFDALARLEGVLAARPVPPAAPGKDYSGVWLPIVVATLLTIAVILALLAWGWRSRRRAQSGIPAPAAAPAALYEQEPALAVEGMYVGTVREESRLDRVAVHGLGLRSRARLEVHAAGAHPGLLVLRPGMDALFVPASDLTSVGHSAGIAGKFTEPGGLAAWGWRLGDVALTSAFRPQRPEDRHRVVDALQTIIDRARTATADPAGQENPR